MKNALLLVLSILSVSLFAQNPNLNYNKFKQLKEEFPTPNNYRTASGAPGHEYYQQQADYKMDITLDDEKQIVSGEEVITYYNNSPDVLTYIWIQLDQNVRKKDADSHLISTNAPRSRMSFGQLKRLHNTFDGGFNIDHVKDGNGDDYDFLVNKTMMRINLKQPLKKGETAKIDIKWWYNINDRMKHGGRSGYEYFEKDDNYLYTIAQFYPRMAVYNEVEGWQNKQFLGNGEFALAFGDYEVNLTVPADHVVGATGVLQNAKDILTKKQLKRLEQAKEETVNPVIIVTQKEAEKAEKSKSKKTKTWTFKAKNVRDFAFASSRKFIWDAMAVKQKSGTVMAMSLYPKEGNPLWEKFSTKAVAHTIQVYSKYTFDYPYPVAYSVHTKRIGMEYPMICFNYGRPEADGTYSDRVKYGMLTVIIHEVGHNYFPMIVNSDERQWTWMDEGLNSFLQYLAEQEWEKGYPSSAGPADKIVGYMKGDKKRIAPIMVNSESILQFGNNAYDKPATALNILRETVMGRELFDMAFKEYATRWMFKHPTPADFFRTMEDASGVDLDWFWRGWFYTTDHVDIALNEVNWFKVNSQNPTAENKIKKQQQDDAPKFIGDIRNEKMETYADRDPSIKDFYTEYNPLEVTILDEKKYEKYLASLSDEDKKLLNAGYNYYALNFKSVGGLVMPVILEFTFADGTSDVVRIPAEIWAKNHDEITKVFFYKKEVVQVVLDPFLETADTDRSNNYWPSRPQPSRFDLYKARSRRSGENGMQRAKRAKEMKK
ncbi:MAG: M1 family metallopeptidase [Saprospiraceae bacterium]